MREGGGEKTPRSARVVDAKRMKPPLCSSVGRATFDGGSAPPPLPRPPSFTIGLHAQSRHHPPHPPTRSAGGSRGGWCGGRRRPRRSALRALRAGRRRPARPGTAGGGDGRCGAGPRRADAGAGGVRAGVLGARAERGGAGLGCLPAPHRGTGGVRADQARRRIWTPDAAEFGSAGLPAAGHLPRPAGAGGAAAPGRLAARRSRGHGRHLQVPPVAWLLLGFGV